MTKSPEKRPKSDTVNRMAPASRRRPPKAKDPLLSLRLGWWRLLEVEAVWILLLFAVGFFVLMPELGYLAPRVEVGAIASRDFVAEREYLILDEQATQTKREQARAAVRPVYDHDPRVARDLDERWARLFAEGRDFLSYPVSEAKEQAVVEQDLLLALQTASSIRIDAPSAAWLRKLSFSHELEDRIRGVVADVLERLVIEDKTALLENRLEGITLRNIETGTETVSLDLYGFLAYPLEVRERVESEVRGWSVVTRADRSLAVELILSNLQANVYLNRAETAARRDAAAEAAERVFFQVRAGQVVLRRGDKITATAARIVDEMGGRQSFSEFALPALGNSLLLALGALVLWLGLRTERMRYRISAKVFGGTVLVLCAALFGMQFGSLLASALAAAVNRPPFDEVSCYLYGVPYASLALTLSLLYGRRVALLVALVFSVFLGRYSGDQALAMMILCLGGSLAAIFSLDQLKQRSAVMRAGFAVAGVNGLTVLMLAAFEGQVEWGVVAFSLVCAFAGGVLVAAVTSFLITVLETALGVTTDIKLLELSDTNLPLLRRLAFEAPGTFQHSLMVANLAKEGCEAIGANAVLAYTGGLYHDVGKVLRPSYFVENQPQGENRHDGLAPSMSALIVINHVKEGVDLARQHRLPQPIVDAIEQHHGNRKLSFFYERARQEATSEVPEQSYRYPGPKPQSKVMAVLMIADAVEAASRTLREPSPTKIRTLLNAIVDDCIEDGQFEETELTFRDVHRVKKALERVLSTIHHKRVDYPGFDFEPERVGLRAISGPGR